MTWSARPRWCRTVTTVSGSAGRRRSPSPRARRSAGSGAGRGRETARPSRARRRCEAPHDMGSRPSAAQATSITETAGSQIVRTSLARRKQFDGEFGHDRRSRHHVDDLVVGRRTARGAPGPRRSWRRALRRSRPRRTTRRSSQGRRTRARRGMAPACEAARPATRVSAAACARSARSISPGPSPTTRTTAGSLIRGRSRAERIERRRVADVGALAAAPARRPTVPWCRVPIGRRRDRLRHGDW